MAEAELAAELFERAPVLDAWDETATLRAVRIDLVGIRPEHRVAGQVIKVRAAAGVGYFALANAPTPDGKAELLVKHGGAVADEVIAGARAGATLDVSPPFGRGFEVEAAEGRDVMLFAAGSGITPIRAMVQHLLAAKRARGRMWLFYGQRHEGEFAFGNEHAEWERGGVRVVLCVSQPSAEWRGARGHVQEVAREIGLNELRPDATIAYVCGMKGMVAGVREVLGAAGVPASRILLNY